MATDPTIPQVAVIGAGTLGHAIAAAFAASGADVRLHDVSRDALDSARDRITLAIAELPHADRDAALRVGLTADLRVAVDSADLVIEAVVENLDVKRATLADVEAAAGGDGRAVIATNSSTFTAADLAPSLAHPGRLVGAHFFHPAHLAGATGRGRARPGHRRRRAR